MCFKVATGGFPGASPTGFTVVLDATTGTPRWLLADGGLLTEMRTAAAGALASATLARPDAHRLLVVGTGEQARAQIHAHREALPHLAVTVWGRNRTAAAALAAELDTGLADDLGAAVADSDIVVTATSSRGPLIESVEPGTHVTAVGSDTPGKQELDPALLRRAEVVACDALDLRRTPENCNTHPASTDERSRSATYSPAAARVGPRRSRSASPTSAASACRTRPLPRWWPPDSVLQRTADRDPGPLTAAPRPTLCPARRWRRYRPRRPA